VLDVRHGKMFSLNLVGSRILALLEAGHQEPWISEELSRQFSISRENRGGRCARVSRKCSRSIGFWNKTVPMAKRDRGGNTNELSL